MFTPTPSSPAVPGRSTEPGAWHIVEVELMHGPNGKAAVAWMASERPLRMQWRVGRRIFKDIESARVYAKSVVGLDVAQ